jgi:hypothetical protein
MVTLLGGKLDNPGKYGASQSETKLRLHLCTKTDTDSRKETSNEVQWVNSNRG